MVALLISIAIVVILSYYSVIIRENNTEDDREWIISARSDGDYGIGLESGPNININKTSFELVDEHGNIINITDESGKEIQFHGDLADIRLDSHKVFECERYAVAKGWVNSTVNSLFHADYPNGSDNRTLYIEFSDRGKPWEIDPVHQEMWGPDTVWVGDGFAIRSILNGGPANQGHRLILRNKENNRVISTITLPRPQTPQLIEPELINQTYQLTIQAIEPVPIESVTYWLFDYHHMRTHRIPGSDLKFEGNLSEITWNETAFSLARDSPWPNSTVDDIFYADYPSGNDNRTSFFIFMDLDMDGNLSVGDVFHCRSQDNQGIGYNYSRLTLFDERKVKYQNSNRITIEVVRFEPFDAHLKWNLSIINDTYMIDLIDITSTEDNDLMFSIVDRNNDFIYIEDNSSALSVERFRTVRFNQDEYNESNTSITQRTYSNKFYTTSDELITLYVIWDDVDGDFVVTSGDRLWLRSESQGGIAEEGYKLRIYHRYYYQLYGTIVFPSV